MSELQALYNGQHISDGLVGWWPLNDASGTTAQDLSGNDNHGTLVNNPEWVDPLSPMAGAPGAPGRIANHVEGVSTFAGPRLIYIRHATNTVEAVTSAADRTASYRRRSVNHVEDIGTDSDRVASYHREAANHVDDIEQTTDRAVTLPRTATNRVDAVTTQAARTVTLVRQAGNHVETIATAVDMVPLFWQLEQLSLDVGRAWTLTPTELQLPVRTDGDGLDDIDAIADRSGDLNTDDSGFGGRFRAVWTGEGDGKRSLHPDGRIRPAIDATTYLIDSYSTEQIAPDEYRVTLTLQRITNRAPVLADPVVDEADEWTVTIAEHVIGVPSDAVGQLTVDGERPGQSWQLPVLLRRDQAAVIADELAFAPGTVDQPVTGGYDSTVDPLDRSTIDIDTPAESRLDSGSYIVTDWQLTQVTPVEEVGSDDRVIRATLTVVSA